VISGIGFVFGLLDPFTITPFTLLLHLTLSMVVASWALTLRVKLPPDKKALFALGIAAAVGSIWSSLQQWIAYLDRGIVNDITLVAGAVVMDIAGGLTIYILYNLNVLGKRIGFGYNQPKSSPAIKSVSP